MKRIIIILLCLATVLFPLAQSFAEKDWVPAKPATIQSKNKTAVVHDMFQFKYTPIGRIANGEIVDLLEFSPDGLWYRIAYAKGTKGGWVKCADLSFNK